MPGRQAHGQSLAAAPKVKAGGKKGSKARSQKNALNAFGIAEDLYPSRVKKTPRVRELDAEIERKHARNDDEEESGETDEEEQPRKKRARPTTRGDGEGEDGSDSEGNEWRLGGLKEDDEDSEIESDDAFGDSDNEKFQEYLFRGSKSKPNEAEDSEDDSDDDQGETLGEDAIDLATALDQWEEESDDEPVADEETDLEDSGDDNSDSAGTDNDDDSSQNDDSDEEAQADPETLGALQTLVSQYGGEEQGKGRLRAGQKLSLKDLGLSNIQDPLIKKSVKLMTKEAREKRPGVAQKLAVPLSRREQGRLDRSAAFDKTKETLDRWQETVKQNRRAEHLVFPLPQNSASAGLDTSEIQPLTTSTNELESTILSIMEQSGLSLKKEAKPRAKEYDEDGNELTRKEILIRKRMERELNSREAKRAKRIKKIKSKAYHRVHRKQRERVERAEQEAADEVDSEAEREAQDRRRALERVGQRHKESKWAKMGSKNKRAVWDEEFRAGLTEMARKDEELRRRKEGKRTAASDDETSSSGSDSDDEENGRAGAAASIRRQLEQLDQEDENDEPQSNLMKMKFMQKAEAAKKQANDDMIRQIRRHLDGEDDDSAAEGEEEGPSASDQGQVGRRSYGTAAAKPPFSTQSHRASRKNDREDADDSDNDVNIITKSTLDTAAAARPSSSSTGGAWSTMRSANNTPSAPASVESRKRSSKAIFSSATASTVMPLVATSSPHPHPKRTRKAAAAAATTTPNVTRSDAGDAMSSDYSDTEEGHPDQANPSSSSTSYPFAIQNQDMLSRAFADDNATTAAEFALEKAQIAQQDDDQVVDNTLPGWGSWVGEGVSKREQRRHQGRFLVTVEGVKKKEHRRDAKLDRVIINEKRIKKNDRYLASQLPHIFESKQQYERSLRMPVGPEWMTKETFQDSTKPRVLMKQGVITPISKPTA